MSLSGRYAIQIKLIKAYNYAMTPSEFITLFVLISVIIYWVNTIFAKEIAVKHGADRCKELGLTFLDATVEITKTRLRRNPRGTVQFRREYSFEFSSDGIRRYSGEIIMLGKVLVELNMSAYPETIIPKTSIPNASNASPSSNTSDGGTIIDITAVDSTKAKSDSKNNFPTGFR